MQRIFAAIKALKEIEAAKVPLTVNDTDGNAVHDGREAASSMYMNKHSCP